MFRPYKPKKDLVGEIIGRLIGRAILCTISAWTFMLLIQAIHTYWLPQVPAVGYGTAFLIVVLGAASTAPLRRGGGSGDA